MTPDLESVMTIALGTYAEDEHRSEVLALSRDIVALMLRCQESGISWAQVLVEADNCLREYNMQRDPEEPAYEGDLGRGTSGGIESTEGAGWSWRVNAQTARWYMRGRLELAQLDDAGLTKTLDFWLGRDESITDSIEQVIELAVASALSAPVAMPASAAPTE
ncbi:hypothetical protein GCM10025782_12980 [Pedococcus ginsenosidimutans]|uniref:Uncharacterized protein n=1 Tax=Pedococcus ginsenosidimutans TaxID=490570 RepID=A0ABP8XZV6_9MICO